MCGQLLHQEMLLTHLEVVQMTVLAVCSRLAAQQLQRARMQVPATAEVPLCISCIQSLRSHACYCAFVSDT